MSTTWKRFFLCAGVAFALGLGILLWLGPVWIHDAEDHLFAFLGSIFLVMFVLALLGGLGIADAAGSAATVVAEGVAYAAAAAAEVAGSGAIFLRRLARGAWPAIGGMISGTLLALVTMWALAHSGPLRLTYARARPTRALAADFVLVASFLDGYNKAHKRPPEDAAALAREMETACVDLRFSTLRGGVWRDPWDRAFIYDARKGFLGWNIQVYSPGPDGRDDRGKPDDISIRETLRIWKVTRMISDALEKYFEERR